MKRLILILSVVISPSLCGMGIWERIKRWFTEEPTKEQLQCPEFRHFEGKPIKQLQLEPEKVYDPFIFQKLPLDMQRHVLLLLAESENIEESTKIIRSFLQTSKLGNVLSSSNFYNSIVNIIADKYGISPLLVHLYISTRIDLILFEKYIQEDAQVLYQIHQQAKFLNYLLQSQKSYNVLKLITDKLPLNMQNNWDDRCLVAWKYANKSYLCLQTNIQPQLETFLARITISGNLDKTFGGQTIIHAQAITNDQPNGITRIVNTVFTPDIGIQKNGKIIIFLDSVIRGFILMRFNTNGTLDTTFGNNNGVIILNLPMSDEDIVAYFNDLSRSNQIIYHLFIDPKNDYVIFKLKNFVKKYTANGEEIE